MKGLITFLLVSMQLVSFGQFDKRKVLVVVYDRIDFSTDYSLNEIARANSIRGDEVYDTLINSLLNVLEAIDNGNISFSQVSEGEYQFIQSKIEKVAMKKPSRQGVVLDNISNKEFNYLLSKNNADFVLFINYYQFEKVRVPEDEKEGLARKLLETQNSGSIEGRLFYSRHLLDFEVYTKDKKRVLAKGRYELPMPGINVKNYKYEGKDVASIKMGYLRYSTWISNEISSVVISN